MDSVIKLNMDDNMRQKIMGFKANYSGGCVQYQNMTLEILEKLIDNNFVDLEDKQNNAPTIGEFRELLKKHKDRKITLHGYIVSPERDDYRITVEGFSADVGTDSDFVNELYQMVKNADVLNIKCQKFYCWYD